MNANPKPKPRFHTEVEIEQAAACLSPGDLKRLQVVARAVIRYYGLDSAVRDHEDLVSEALIRTLSGSRSWRQGVDFVYHLAQSMRSVAWTWFEQEEEKRAESGSMEHWEEAMLGPAEGQTVFAIAGWIDPGPDAETVSLAREQIQMIWRAFVDDPAASAVLSGWAIGCKGPEIQELHGLSDKAFQAAVRRIRRFAQRGDHHAS